jgi:hypothetical protein
MHTTSTFAAGLRRAATAFTVAATLSGCGGSDFVESLVRLISARFVPAESALAAGGTRRVELEVSCDREGLDTPFGRLGIQIRLDPEQQLPAGVTATLVSAEMPDAEGFVLLPCRDPTADDNIRVAHVMVDLAAAADATAGASTLVALVRIEPMRSGEPSKDSTTAALAIAVTGGGTAPTGSNRLINAGFEHAVQVGALPTGPDNWRGDLAASVAGENGIAPHGGNAMLKFNATGTVGSTSTFASQQWQIVDLSDDVVAVSTGAARAEASAWFARVAANETGDRRFDLRILAFDGSPADLPARYAASSWIAEQSTSTVVATPGAWQQATASLVLPATTRYLLVEVNAFEDVLNDGADATEFAGHYADDVSLTLVRP